MNEYVKGGIVAGGTVGAVLLGQWAYKQYFETGSNNSVLTGAVGSARHALDNSPDRVPLVKVGFPVIANGGVTDGPVNNSNMDGLNRLAMSVFGNDNAANIAMGFLSCECMSGDLIVDCGNCSLFNIHWTSRNVMIDGEVVDLPYAWKGNDKIISFMSNQPTQVDGFLNSLQHFKGFLERRAPNALVCMQNRDWSGFQIEISRIGYATSYTNSVSGNTVRHPFIRNRYTRLVNSGRLHAPGA